MKEDQENLDSEENLEPISEDSSYGNISINNEVVANIVAMAARDVKGVLSIASGGLKDDLAGLFGGKRDGGTGVLIKEDNDGRYNITVKVILTFGEQLAKVAQDVQIAVRQQVNTMTNKEVSKVDVIVDGVRHPDFKESPPIEE